MLLILLDQLNQGVTTSDLGFWLSPRRARELYSVSADTWAKGARELSEWGLVAVKRVPVDEGAFGWRRVRNLYLPRLDFLDTAPGAAVRSPP